MYDLYIPSLFSVTCRPIISLNEAVSLKMAQLISILHRKKVAQKLLNSCTQAHFTVVNHLVSLIIFLSEA